MAVNHSESFFLLASTIARGMSTDKKLESMVLKLSNLQHNNGRLFILGVGGSAANSSHAVNDFRKLCGIEAYAPTDNVSELTARINDEGWNTSFVEWLKVSKLRAGDALLIMSVGGGNEEKQVSMNLVHAIHYAKSVSADIYGIVGSEEGVTAKEADLCIVIPAFYSDLRTPITEAFQAVVWHCFVSHPYLQTKPTKW